MTSFTPESRVLAAFTFVVTLVIGGWQQVAMLTVRLIGPFLPDWQAAPALVVSVVVAVLAVAAMRIGATGAAAATAAWARHLGHATALLAFLVVAAAAVSALSAILHGTSSTPYPF